MEGRTDRQTKEDDWIMAMYGRKAYTVKPFIFVSFAFASLTRFKGLLVLQNHINIGLILTSK